MFDLKDKVCLVTGAAGGIGLGFVKGFLQRGAKCLMVDVNYRASSKNQLRK
jgi:NAD(P)-dependent dehydrogenase (short-subunit alcohol dehydrogenase family)